MKSKLLTIARTDLLYLPIVQLNTTSNGTAGSTTDPTATALADTTNSGSYVITVNAASSTLFTSGTFHGVIQGDNVSAQSAITFDQGIDNNALGLTPLGTANTLTETAYVVEVDNRLGVLVDPSSGEDARVSFVDDDQIASYYFSLQGEVDSSAHFGTIPQSPVGGTPTSNDGPIEGRPGLRFNFKVRATDNLAGSNYLFDTLGASDMVITQGSFRYIDSTIRVTGFTTGFRVDIPVRFAKLI